MATLSDLYKRYKPAVLQAAENTLGAITPGYQPIRAAIQAVNSQPVQQAQTAVANQVRKVPVFGDTLAGSINASQRLQGVIGGRVKQPLKQTAVDALNVGSYFVPAAKIPKALELASPAIRLAGSSLIRGIEGGGIQYAKDALESGVSNANKNFLPNVAGGALLNTALSPKLAYNAFKPAARTASRIVQDIGNQSNIQKAVRGLNAEVPHTVESTSQLRSAGGKFGQTVETTKPIPTREIVLDEKNALKVLKKGSASPDLTVINRYKAGDTQPKVKLHLDSQGNVVSWSPERSGFAERLVNSPYAQKNDYQKALKVMKGEFTGDTGTLSLKGAQARTEQPQTNAFKTGKTGSQGAKVQETLVDNNPKLNVNRLNISPEVKQVLSETIDANNSLVSRAKGPKISRKAVVAAANNLVKESNGVISHDEILKYQAAMLNTRQRLAAASDASGGKMTPQLQQALMEDLSNAKFLASSLSNRAISADGKEISPIVRFVKEISKHGTDIEEVLRASEGVDFNDAKQSAEFYRKFVKPNLGDWVDLLRYNSMLSSPNTHINNASGNLLNTTLIRPLEKSVTGAVDFIGSSISGSKRQAFVGEGPAYAKGYWSNVGQAYSKFSNVMAGKAETTNLDTRSIPLATQGAKGTIHSLLGYPMKLLEASDQFFTQLAVGGEEAALRVKQSRGVKVGDVSSNAQEKAAYTLYRRDLGNSEQGHVLDGIDKITGIIESGRNSSNSILRQVAKFTLPFVKTPMNIFKQGLEYSPAGVLTIPGATNKEEQIAKAVIGSSVFAGASSLLGSGRITWSEPTSTKEKTAFKSAGMQAYSVKFGNTWVSFQKLPPAVAFPLAMVAALDDAEKNRKLDQNTTEQVLSGIAKYGQFLSDQSYAKSVGDLLSATKTENGIAKAVSNYPQQLVPYRALTGWLARLTDDTQRQVATDSSFIDKQVQQLMLQYPGLSQKIPARLDESGQPLPSQNPVLNAFSPVRVSSENPIAAAEYQQVAGRNRQDSLARQQVNVLRGATTTVGNDVSPSSTKASGTASTLTRLLKPLANGKYAYKNSAGDVTAYATQGKALAAAAKDRVISGVSNREQVGSTVYVADQTTDSGYKAYDLTKIKKQTQDLQVALLTEQAKKADDYQTWEALQKDAYNQLDQQKRSLDTQLDAPEILQLQKKQADIVQSVQKYRSYGGAFKKPPKVKKPRVRSVKTRLSIPKATASRITQPKIKSQKIKLAKVKIKQPKY